MKSFSIWALVIMTFVPSATLVAKPTVKLHKPPPGRWGIEDLWKARVTSDTVCDAWFEGFVYEETRGQVFQATTKPFRLSLGTKVYQYRDVKVDKTQTARGYEVFVTRSGHLPAGSYRFKLKLQPFDVEESFEFEVKPIGPPRLISPRDGDNLQQDPPFTWTRPPGGTGRIAYALKLVEVLPGQSNEEALRANRPWFLKQGLNGTSFRYPASARKLEEGKRYAWEVTAELGGGVRPVESEKWGFSKLKFRPKIVVKGPLGITREVERFGNWYRVELRIVNNSSAPVSNIVVTDSSRYFQCVDEAQIRKPPLPGGQLPPELFNWLPVDNEVLSGGNGFASAIEMDLGSWALGPGRTVQLRYPVVPIIHHNQVSGGKYQASGGKPAPMMFGGAAIGIQLRVCFSMNDDQHCKTYPGKAAAMSALVSQALTSADYLLVTVPSQLFGLYSAASVTDLLVTMARLAKAKNGVLGYSELLGHVDLFLLLYQGGKWANRMNPAWATSGYLLLVGEGNVVPHWPTLHNVPDRPIRYSDHMFSNLHWSTRAPRLKVGRIVGRTAADLEIGIQNSLDVYYHTGGASYSGVKGWMATGIEVPHKGDNFTLQGEQGAKYLRDNKGMTCVVWGQEFITTRDRVLEKALRHKGRAAGGAHINPDSSKLNTITLKQLAAWLLEITVGLPPSHSGDQPFTDSEGRARRVPYGFDNGDIAQAGHQAEDIENSRRGAYPKAYIYAADWSGANGLIDNVFARDLPKHDVCFWSAHGNWDVFNALNAADVAAMDLRKHKRRPVVVSFGCYNGAYFNGTSDGIVRAYLKSGGGAFFGYTEMTSTGWFRDEVGDPYRFVQNWHTNRRMGIIMNDWKTDLSVTQASNSGDRRMLYGTNLYGDPKFGGN